MKLVLGIDIGSTAVKGVLYGGEALEWGLAPTGWSPRDAGQSMIAELLRRHELSEKDLAALISTGYGRRTLTAATKQVTEITCLARGVPRENIVRGLLKSIASRSAGMLAKVGMKPPLFFSGGLSRSPSLRAFLERELDCPVQVHEKSQFAGALGAALIGWGAIE